MFYPHIYPWRPSLGYSLSSFKILFNFHHNFRNFVMVVMVHSFISSSKGITFIVSSAYSTIFTRSSSLCWRVLIYFFGVGIFTYINTYIECSISFFFLGCFTVLVNTTSESVPGFVPGLNYIPSFPLSFFGVPISVLPSNLRFLCIMGSFPCVFFIR